MGAWHLVHAAVHRVWSSEAMVGTWRWLHDTEWLSSINGTLRFWEEVVQASRTIRAAPVIGWALATASAIGPVARDAGTLPWRLGCGALVLPS
jgi:hypothetical protein